MDRRGEDVVEHVEVFVLTRTAERMFVRCDCSVGADHPFERPLGVRPDDDRLGGGLPGRAESPSLR